MDLQVKRQWLLQLLINKYSSVGENNKKSLALRFMTY